ncbi:neutrophil gelatinase-associated lipocalin [Pogona vitticeps]
METATFPLALGLIHACLAPFITGIPVQPGFRYKKVEGEWQCLAMAVRGAEPAVVASKIKIFPMPRGDLIVGRNIIVRLACSYFQFQYRNAGQPGVFNVFLLGEEPSKIHVVATDYTRYLMLHIQRGRDRALYLFGRELEVSDTTMKKFDHYVRSLGFSGTVEYPPPDEECSLP